MIKKLGILIILLGAAFAIHADLLLEHPLSEGYIDQIEYVNHAEKLSIDDINNIDPTFWKVAPSHNINLGFTADHYWFRISLKETIPLDKTWIFRSKNPLLDTLDLYLFSGSTLIQEFHTGDSLVFSKRPIIEPSFSFPLFIKRDPPHVIYLHAHSSSSLQLSLSLQNESAFWQILGAENARKAAFYAVLISMIIYNAVIFFMVRVRNYLYYVLYLSAFSLFMASTHGLAYRYFWPNNPEINQIAAAVLTGAIISTAGLFISNFLRIKEIRPNLHRFLILIIALGFISSIASFFVPYTIMIQIVASLGLITALIAVFWTLQEWYQRRSREVMIFIIAWSSVLIGYILYIGQKFGALPVNTFTEHAVEIGAVLEALLLALGLADRINSERKVRIQAQERMLEIQHKANEELENKVHERTKELERINSKLHAASITDSLTQIRNRHYFDYKFSAEYRRAYRSQSPISLIILDIDHFKKFNDQYGHQAGDEVLRIVASAIKNTLQRPSDTPFRYGGEEFTVLLPNTIKEGALIVAERMREKIEKTQIEWEGNKLYVTVSIGIASCLPSQIENQSSLLKEADDYLYIAKENGRNQVIFQDNNPKT